MYVVVLLVDLLLMCGFACSFDFFPFAALFGRVGYVGCRRMLGLLGMLFRFDDLSEVDLYFISLGFTLV